MKISTLNKSTVALMILVTLISCDDYLGLEPKGKRLLESTEDYNLWLNNQRLHQSAIYDLSYFSDLRDIPDIDDVWDTQKELAYTWQPQLSDEPFDNSPVWSYAYSNIYYYNAVIQQVLGSSGGTLEEKESLRAEALVGRALIYLNLVNLYGKVYNEATASEDLAVPFVTSVDVTDDTPPRSTVQAIYDHIISDLEEALPNLPEDNSGNRFRGSIASAYGVLARTYLYMREYELAAQNAQKALESGPNDVLVKLPGEGIDYLTRPDIILARKGGRNNYYKVVPTLDLLNAYDVDDLRLKLNYEGLEDKTYPYEFSTRGEIIFSPHGVVGGAQDYPNWGIDVSEMYLIIAEAAARSGDTETACNQLHIVRSKRFLEEDYERFESEDQEEVLEKVFQERVFEFPFSGLRWYDMRRLVVEGRLPTIYRYDGSGTVIAKLEPDSPRYVLQIPLQILSFNQNWEQNP